VRDIIREYSLEFREAIEKLNESEITNSKHFLRFPRGCCGDASDLLAKYLLSKGIETSYDWGMYNGQSHGWLVYHNYLIDITADQFDEINEKVVVTNDATWYLKFRNPTKKLRTFEDFNIFNYERLNEIYEAIMRKIV